nr:aminotransferase class V-fold PLP-dependent enzyme [uncultured Oscillibacter sp.]
MIEQNKNWGLKSFIPLLTFLAVYLGAGIVFSLMGTENPFKQISREFAVLCGLTTVILLSRSRKNIDLNIDLVAKHCGEPGVMLMIMIFALAGAFSGAAEAMGGTEAAVATGSGMGAISSALWSIAGAGKHILADKTLYGCTFALLGHGMTRYGVEVTFIDTSDLKAVEENLRENTCAVYLETPANPTLKIADIQAVARIAHGYDPDIKVVVDNTFATPYLQRPLELGADMVVHSATKFLNGHGDALAGFVCGRRDLIDQVRMFGVKDMTGSVLGAQEAFLVLRGLKTFELRMMRHCENARKLADYLVTDPRVETVYFPGVPTHPGHETAKKQMRCFGPVMSIEIKGGKQAGMDFVDHLRMCRIAVSLGDAETLVQHAASMTHSAYSSEELKAAGIPEGLVRISVGLENAEDIIADVKRALDHVK